MRTLESRLRELAESTKYRKAFEGVKNSILSSEKLDKIIYKSKDGKTICQNSLTSFAALVYWSGKRYEIYFADHGIGLRGQRTPLTLEKVRTLLKEGNLNDHYLEIPYAYSDFKTKYKLEYFFDPGRAYPQGFDPFHDIPVWVESTPDGRRFAPFLNPEPSMDGTKVLIGVNIAYPLGVLEKELKAQIKNLKGNWKLKEERKDRYLDDEIYKVKELIQEGLNSTEIFRELHPEHKSFKFSRDYVTRKKPTLEAFDAVAKLQRVKRLVKEAKKRMDKWDT